jgi:hypothetical protein
MRKTVSLGLMLAMVSAISTPLFAQPESVRTSRLTSDRNSGFASLRAVTDGNGVLIRWETFARGDAAGFNVYRVDGDTVVKVNPSIILGFPPGPGVAVRVGASRQYFDVEGREGSRYIVEALGWDGSRLRSQSSNASPVKDLEAEIGVSSAALRNAALTREGGIESRSQNLTEALSDLVSAYTQNPNPLTQRYVASKSGVKIAVKSDGFYRVTAAELAAANFQLDSDPSKWRLFTDGIEQSIIVSPDRSFVEFYGRGIDLPETDARIYYLIADTVPGKRMATKLLRNIPGTATAKNFTITFERKDRREANFELFNGDGENFLGALFDTSPTRVRFNLNGIDFSQPTATIRISLFGHSENANHRVLPKINGYDLPPMTQFGRVFYSESFVIPTEQLNEGQNDLELASSTNGDYNIFDKVEVTYKRNFIADSSVLSFYTPGSKRVDLDGFATAAVRVIDTTFDGSPVLLTGLPVQQGSTGFRVSIPASRMMVGYAFDESSIKSPESVVPNLPSTLSRKENAAEMVIISHSAPSFLAAAETWANYRRSAAGGGFTTKVVDVADIFDEFGYGLTTAESIKSFLKYAVEEWDVAPKYVLLLGDASYDPRNYEGFGSYNLVPSRSTMFIDDESFSDELLGDFDGDDVSSVAIGRIPARTADQITTAFNKLVAYEANQLSFGRGAVFANDAPIGYEFSELNQRLAALLPPGTPVENVSATQGAATQSLISAFNRGRFLVNYSGHGSSGFWASSQLLDSASVSQLSNRDNPSLVTMLTCLSGHFAQNTRVSLAEVLLFSQNGGAAATWASTGSTTADIQSVLADKFFRELVANGQKRIGDTIKAAKSQTPSGRDVKLSWALLGDPAMRMP